MKTNQKEVRLISFVARNHRIIEAVELKPDLLSKKLIEVKGDIGNGKSTLVEAMQISMSGSDAVKKKEALDDDFFAEIQLLDGEIPIWLGARSNKKSDNSTDFKIFIYSKDVEGKKYTPVIDGKRLTASSYGKMLTTALTFKMPELFSENATVQRNLIQNLFEDELKKLGVEELYKEIKERKAERDQARALCDSRGAFMETFKDLGHSEDSLALMKHTPIKDLEKKKTELEIERSTLSITHQNKYDKQKSNWELEKEKNINSLNDSLNKIKDKLSKKNNDIRTKYIETVEKEKKAQKEALENKRAYFSLFENLSNLSLLSESDVNKIKAIVSLKYSSFINYEEKELNSECPNSLLISSSYNGDDEEAKTLLKNLSTKETELNKVKESTFDVELGEVSYETIDKSIEEIETKIDVARGNNNLVEMFELWTDWREKVANYDEVVNDLRILYGKVDVGVEGMKIMPVERSGNVEIYMQYNGAYDKEFFHNEKGEYRYLFDYSASQRGVIGLLLQSARLDLKDKALRLAILDDVPMTKKGLDVISKICNDFNLQLITTNTTDDYDLKNLADNEIVVEGGEVFFKNI